MPSHVERPIWEALLSLLHITTFNNSFKIFWITILNIKSAPPYHPNTYSAPAASADFSSAAPVWRGPWDSRRRRRFHGYESRTGIYQGLRFRR